MPLNTLSGPLCGPALLVEPHSTLVLEPGWTARPLAEGSVLLEDAGAAVVSGADGIDPARIEIFNNLFMHIAEQMGEVLKATAQSVNIRERLDYSCALFDRSGGLVANAPHMPVHLGSMGASVRAVIQAQPQLRRGDAWLINSPYHGGTHLPDMTVVTPVFIAAGRKRGFLRRLARPPRRHRRRDPRLDAALQPHDRRGRHPLRMLRAGERRDAQRGAAARAPGGRPVAGAPPGPEPRRPARAAGRQRARHCRDRARRAPPRPGRGCTAYMRAVQDNAAHSVRNAIARLTAGSFRYEMDNGDAIAVASRSITRARRARVDFTGTSAQGNHNFNAPRAVCMAAVLYVFRTLIEAPHSAERGLPGADRDHHPARARCSTRAPPAAVAAGNVETSQCIVDALYGALGVLAASQGTMNNLTFGDARLQYYETIAGGAGAGPGFAGCDAVQTHMTNSRLTDPEILEAEYPLLVREFSIRAGSGGAGRWPGGAGTVRRLEFRAPFTGALLANHRRIAPFGVAGGHSASSRGGAHPPRERRAGGSWARLPPSACGHGDELTVLTPGGGGFGAPQG